jgi:DNA mismatch repair protein MutS
LPATVVARAKEILAGLERDELSRGGRPTLSGGTVERGSAQLGLFAPPGGSESAAGTHIVAQLAALDLDDVTPRQALDLLASLKQQAEAK